MWFEWRLCQNQRHSNINWSQMTRRPNVRETRNKTRNTPNSIFAIPAAVPAIVENPRKAAASAMIRKKTDQDNMGTSTSIVFMQLYSPEKQIAIQDIPNVE